MKLLTIIIPTYNRQKNLKILLAAILAEASGLEAAINIVIGDNCSTDETEDITKAFAEAWPSATVIRHKYNIGPEENFCRCLEKVDSEYFWIIGDDDCPKRGVISNLVNLLSEHRPGIVYMQSEWVENVTGPDHGEPLNKFNVVWDNAYGFAHRVHVWFTFISGVVISRQLLRETIGNRSMSEFVGTSLPQLAWTLPLLQTSGPFAYIPERCILATKGNSGGYALLTVFGANFARIAGKILGPTDPIGKMMIRRNLLHYLPGLIWGARTGSHHRHTQENPWETLREQLGDQWLFWLLLTPLGRFPRWAAQPFYQAWRVFHRIHRDWTRIRVRVSTPKLQK